MARRLTEGQFAAQAAYLAKNAAAWAGDICNSPDNLSDPAKDETVARFIGEMSERLDRLWCWGVTWSRAAPVAGEPGDTMMTPRISTIWPGDYAARCVGCSATMLAAKRAPSCDPCELARRSAYDARRAELERHLAGRAALDGGADADR